MTDRLRHRKINTVTGNDFDATLLSKLGSGDQEAFRFIYMRLYNPLFLFIARLVGSDSWADDICQEVFATLWQKHAQVDSEKNIKSFVFGIAKRVVWNYMRDHNRRTALFTKADPDPDDGFTPGLDKSLAHGLTPDDIVRMKETELLIEHAVSKLPGRTRDVFELHFYENASISRIAETLGISPGNARVQLHRARKIVQESVLMLIITTFLIP